MPRNLCLLGILSACQWVERSWEQRQTQTAITHATSFDINQPLPSAHDSSCLWVLEEGVSLFSDVIRVFYWDSMMAGLSTSPDLLSWICFVLGVLFLLSKCPGSSQYWIRNICIWGHFLFWSRLHICYGQDSSYISIFIPNQTWHRPSCTD